MISMVGVRESDQKIKLVIFIGRFGSIFITNN